MNLNERLRATRHFQELDAGELDALASAMQVIEAEDGHVFLREGDRADGCYLVVEGQVRVTHERDGEVHQLKQLRPGDLFGLVALLDHGRRSATCSSVGASTCAWLPAAAFTLLHEGNPVLALHFQKLVARQLARDARTLNDALVAAMRAQDDHPARGGHSLSGEFHITAPG